MIALGYRHLLLPPMETLRSAQAGPSKTAAEMDSDEDFVAILTSGRQESTNMTTSTPKANTAINEPLSNSSPPSNIPYGPELPRHMREPSPQLAWYEKESHSFLLSPEERQRQRDMSYGLRLPIETEETHPEDNDSDKSISDMSDDLPVEQPSPIYTRRVTLPQQAPVTPPRNLPRFQPPELRPVFGETNLDLTGAMVQLLSWEGGRRDQEIKIKISDGTNWVEARLNNVYKSYFIGQMFHDLDIFKILKTTGNVSDKSLFVVSTFNQLAQVACM